jgi:membrane protein DedA with SNARE-associated domain
VTTAAGGIRNFDHMDTIGHLVTLAAASPWALALVALALVIDGFFPFVPGESLVVATAAATAAAGGTPWLVLAVAVPAALVGDLIAYRLGRRLGVERWITPRRPRLAKAFGYAQHRLEVSPASILLTAKFLPFVRVAVSMTAGAGRMPFRRYFPLAVASVSLYTGFHLVLGVVVGSAAFAVLGNPLIALAVSIAVGLAVGVLIDLAVRGVRAVRARRASRPAAATDTAATPASTPAPVPRPIARPTV